MSLGRFWLALFLLVNASLAFAADDPPKKSRNKEEIVASIPIEVLEDGVVLQSGEIKIKSEQIRDGGIKGYIFNMKKLKAGFEDTPKERAEAKKMLAFNLLSQAVLEQYVAQNKWTASKDALEHEIEKIKATKKKQGSSYEDYLLVNGFTDEEFRRFVEASVAIQEKMLQTISDDEASKEFEERVRLRRASDILFMFKGSTNAPPAITRSKEDAKAAAVAALEQIRKDPASFVQLVKDVSDGPSRQKDGDLGWLAHKGGMVDVITDALYKLEKPGDVSEVLESPFGFHIVKLSEVRTMDDVKKGAGDKFNEMKAEIKAMMVSEKVGNEMQRLIEEASAKAKFNEKEVKVP
jgi:parvulin-like peptidyl-prolyl isomerase